MQLLWTEIRNNAIRFSKKWENAEQEESVSQSFLREFFQIFGIEDLLSVGSFEYKVNKDDSQKGYIDYLWFSKIAVEMKSAGKNLKKAYEQLKEYVIHLDKKDIPDLLMVCDFQNIWLYNRTSEAQIKFKTKNLKDHVKHFSLIAGYETTRVYETQKEVNVKASEKMARLHNAMESAGYSGHELQIYLVRLLYCLFADDTGIFPKDAFLNYVENSKEDGSDLSGRLARLFEVLDMTPEKRENKKLLTNELQQFLYVNGGLFTDRLPIADFDSTMRQLLIDAGKFDWQYISPAIFGAMFQGIMNKDERHDIGAHYTSEENILKVINPLFMDELWEEFEKVKSASPIILDNFHKKIASLKFLDPACGCGNFLIIAYRELRRLEYEILRMKRNTNQLPLDPTLLLKVNVNQFYGIELLDFPCQVAQVGMWLMDHLMNMKMAEDFGIPYVRLPLKQSAAIACRNALTTDWNKIIPASELSYIIGNPPFLGARVMNKVQKTELEEIFKGVPNSGNLDYVSCWYRKTLDMMKENTAIKASLVSTNSITQGEQVGILWNYMFSQGVFINFAHKTFVWSNEAKNKAAVHCVIIGFSLHNNSNKIIFSEENKLPAKNINGYLFDSKNIFLQNRKKPLCDVPEIGIGIQPIDDGNYIFTEEEKKKFIELEPNAEAYFYNLTGSHEFLHNKLRYCLYLAKCPISELKNMPYCRELMQKVKIFREKSNRAATKKLASTPAKFQNDFKPESNYLIIPRTSSEKRKYIPIGFMDKDTISTDTVLVTSDAELYHFAILTSSVHMAWMKAVTGRLKSDYLYSAGIVYNNFPWVENIAPDQKEKIENLAKSVLNARNSHPDESLADLYGDLMPEDLMKAHKKLDAAVLALYGLKKDASEDTILATLFNRYEELIKKENQHILE